MWLQKGSASLAAASLRQIDPPVPRATLKAVVEQDYQHKSYAVREGKVAEFDAFCNRMRLDDYLLATSQGKTYLGRVAGEATYTLSSDRRSNLRRKVEWWNTTRPVPFANLPPAAAGQTTQPGRRRRTDQLRSRRSSSYSRLWALPTGNPTWSSENYGSQTSAVTWPRSC
ncbi:MAG: hypothetical protein WAN20_23645 [Pseudonocardiaceae bacterium]